MPLCLPYSELNDTIGYLTIAPGDKASLSYKTNNARSGGAWTSNRWFTKVDNSEDVIAKFKQQR